MMIHFLKDLFSYFKNLGYRKRKGKVGDQCCGIVGYTPSYDTSIPHGYQLNSWPTHFWSSSLLRHLGKQHGMAHVPGPLPSTWEIKKKLWTPGLVLVQHWPLNHLWSEPEDGLSVSLSCTCVLSLPLTLYSSGFQISKCPTVYPPSLKKSWRDRSSISPSDQRGISSESEARSFI